MPTVKQPPAAKSNEPAPQKPDLKLPLDAIRAGRSGATPLSEHIRKHEEKRKGERVKGRDRVRPVLRQSRPRRRSARIESINHAPQETRNSRRLWGAAKPANSNARAPLRRHAKIVGTTRTSRSRPAARCAILSEWAPTPPLPERPRPCCNCQPPSAVFLRPSVFRPARSLASCLVWEWGVG